MKAIGFASAEETIVNRDPQRDGLFPVADGPHYPNGTPFTLAEHLTNLDATNEDWQELYGYEYDQVDWEFKRRGKYVLVLVERTKPVEAQEAEEPENLCNAYECVKGSLLQHAAWMMNNSLALCPSASPYLKNLLTVVSARCRDRWSVGSIRDLLSLSWELNRFIAVSSGGAGGMSRPDHAHGHVAPFRVSDKGGRKFIPFGLPGTQPDVRHDDLDVRNANARAFLADWPCIALGLEGPPNWKADVLSRLLDGCNHTDYAILFVPDGRVYWIPRSKSRPDKDPRPVPQRDWGSFEACGCVLFLSDDEHQHDKDRYNVVKEDQLDEAISQIGLDSGKCASSFVSETEDVFKACAESA